MTWDLLVTKKIGSKVGCRGGVDDRWEASWREYGDWLRQLWRLCDPGVVGGTWVACKGDRMVERIEGTVVCGCVFGKMDDMFN